MAEMKMVGVDLPPSVVKIIRAAGGTDQEKGGMPYAMAAIVGALPWIAVAVYEKLPKDEYKAFVKSLQANMWLAWQIIGAKNPSVAFDAAVVQAKRSIQ